MCSYRLGEGLGWKAEASVLSRPLRVPSEVFLQLHINEIRLRFRLNRDQPVSARSTELIGVPEVQVEAQVVEERVHGIPNLAHVGEALHISLLGQWWLEEQ